MQLISYLVQHYFNIKYENFTGKIIAARAIFEVIQDAMKEDTDRLEWIEENTHEDVMVSIYELDRDINPSKKEFSQIVKKNKYTRNDARERESKNQETTVTLSPGIQQNYLCCAIREVNQIVCRNIKEYSEEIKIPLAIDDGSSGELVLDLDITKKEQNKEKEKAK